MSETYVVDEWGDEWFFEETYLFTVVRRTGEDIRYTLTPERPTHWDDGLRTGEITEWGQFQEIAFGDRVFVVGTYDIPGMYPGQIGFAAWPKVPASYTVEVPGAFADWFSGTGVAQGEDNADPDCKAMHEAWTSATHVRRGFGYALRLTGPRQILTILEEYARTVLNVGDAHSRSERDAAQKVIERVKSARQR